VKLHLARAYSTVDKLDASDFGFSWRMLDFLRELESLLADLNF
jgi:hypothetical protein